MEGLLCNENFFPASNRLTASPVVGSEPCGRVPGRLCEVILYTRSLTKSDVQSCALHQHNDTIVSFLTYEAPPAAAMVFMSCARSHPTLARVHLLINALSQHLRPAINQLSLRYIVRHLALFEGEYRGDQVFRGRSTRRFDVCVLHEGQLKKCSMGQ